MGAGASMPSNMGAGASMTAPWPSAALAKELHDNLNTQDQFAESFAQFIKNGHWLNNIGYMCHSDEAGRSRKKKTGVQVPIGDTRWVFLEYILPEGCKSITDDFMHEHSDLRRSISSIREDRRREDIKKKKHRRKQEKVVTSDFQEAYKYDPETAVFSMDDMCSLMVSIIFPLYVTSMEFEHWKRWLLLKEREPVLFEDYCGNPEVDQDFETGTYYSGYMC
jgi:hypothetical protein